MKGFRKYFLEFLMLFLAVFLGFIADNFRDRITEKSREKEYVRSLVDDVQIDKIIIGDVIKNNTMRMAYLDTLSDVCFNYNPKIKDYKVLYKYYPIVIVRPDFFIPSEFTMLQLKNAGGMRTIRNKTAVRAILKYELQKAMIFNQQKYYENYQNSAIQVGVKIFNHKSVVGAIYMQRNKDTLNLKDLSFNLIRTDKEIISQFGNEVIMYKGIVDYYNKLLEETNKQADTLILKLKQAYRID